MLAQPSMRVLVVESTGSGLGRVVSGIMPHDAVVVTNSIDRAIEVIAGRDGAPDLLIVDLDAGPPAAALGVIRAMGAPTRDGPVRPTIAVASRAEDLEGLPGWVVRLPKSGAKIPELQAALGTCASPESSWAREAADRVATLSSRCRAEATRRARGAAGR